jgi:thiol-disulfide isomerase/thioredoxin
MKFDKYILLCILLFFGIEGRSQNEKPLVVGQQMPDVTLNKMMNTTYKSTTLHSFKQDLVILDFWATWCSSCIEAMPELQEIQNKYKDNVQVLLINNPGIGGDDELKIQAFLKSYSNKNDGKQLSLPIALGADKLGKFFPHIYIPHTVWLYKGFVKAISSPDQVTQVNIEAVLKGLPLTLEQKKDNFDFDTFSPLLVNGNGGDEKELLRRSLFTHYLPGISSKVGRSISKDSTLQRLFFINQSIAAIYNIATQGISSDRLVVDISRIKTVNTTTDKDNFKKLNKYCYELTVPISMSRGEIDTIIRADLNTQFGLSSRIEKKMVDCFVITSTDELGSVVRANSQESRIIYADSVILLKNQPLSALIGILNEQNIGHPLSPLIIDETRFKDKVDMKLPINMQTLDIIQNALLPYGLKLIPTEREIAIFIVSKAKKPD